MKTLTLSLLFLLLSTSLFAQREIIIPGADGEPVFTFLEDTPDPAMRQIPREITAKRQNATVEFVSLLAAYIDENSNCDFERIKKVHDWVTLNIRYDTQSYFSGRYSPQDSNSVIRRGSGVCAGYADVFKMICDVLEIPCIVVSGFSRGFGRRLFSVEDTSRSNHAWNMVTINGKNYLIDTTWNAGTVSSQSFQAKYITNYLFIDPAIFIYDHFPMNPAYQLLDPPLSSEEFTNLPFLKPNYFKAVKKWTNLNRITKLEAGETMQLEFELNEGYDFCYIWYAHPNTRITSHYPSREDVYRVNVLPHRTGRFFLRIYVKKNSERTYWSCGEFGFER